MGISVVSKIPSNHQKLTLLPKPGFSKISCRPNPLEHGSLLVGNPSYENKVCAEEGEERHYLTPSSFPKLDLAKTAGDKSHSPFKGVILVGPEPQNPGMGWKGS